MWRIREIIRLSSDPELTVGLEGAIVTVERQSCCSHLGESTYKEYNNKVTQRERQ
jgi:hypothetical protein